MKILIDWHYRKLEATDLSMNQYLFLGKDEEIYNTEEEIVKNFTLGEKNV